MDTVQGLIDRAHMVAGWLAEATHEGEHSNVYYLLGDYEAIHDKLYALTDGEVNLPDWRDLANH